MPVVLWSSPEDFEQGGLLNDVDVEFTNCRFEMFDYKGKADPVTAFAAELKQDNGDVSEQYWSCGGSKTDMRPSDDGEGIQSDSGITLKRGSAFHALHGELIKFGVDKTLFGKASNLNGLRAHMVRRKLGTNKKEDGTDNQVLLPTEILKGKGKPAAGANKPAAAAAPVAAAEPSGDISAEASKHLAAIAGKFADGTTLDVKALKVHATKALLKHPQRQEVINTMIDPAWLDNNAADASLAFDASTSSLVKV